MSISNAATGETQPLQHTTYVEGSNGRKRTLPRDEVKVVVKSVPMSHFNGEATSLRDTAPESMGETNKLNINENLRESSKN